MIPPPGKIVIAGGTGLVGRALTETLRDQGHRVLLLTRRPAPGRLAPGVALHPWEDIQGAMMGAAAVFNLCGEPIASRRWSPAQRLRILESRTLSTRRIVEALGQVQGPRVLVNASAIGFYGTRDRRPVDEGSPLGQGFLPSVCRAWEAEADAAPSPIRVVKLRLGPVLSMEGGALPRLARIVRWGLGSRLGSGEQGMSWIHIEDLVRILVEAALDPAMEGVYNAVAPAPLSNEAFTQILGRVLHRPIIPVPGWVTAPLLRLALGPLAEEMILGGAFVRPARLLARGFEFRFPELEGALENLLR
ncbi:MAG: hypothetical protein H6Q00_2393 [Holophagaceae bacterium]|nr:hypothetical protein [Holophagaceae bacterium]